MLKKLIIIQFTLVLCLLGANVHASEITGTLSSNGVGSTAGGSISGSTSGGGSGGGGGISSGSVSNGGGSSQGSSQGQVLGLQTEDPGLANPGLPNTGFGEYSINDVVEFLVLFGMALVLFLVGMKEFVNKKV